MKKIVVANNKGGVGKSGSCVQIGGVFSYIGKRVLLIDCDPQSNLTKRLKLKDSKYFLEDLLMGKCKIEDVLKQPYPDIDKLSNIWVIPSSFNLSTIEKQDSSFEERYTFILSQVLKEIEGSFDFIILDTNPSPTLLTNMMAYCYADFLIGVLDMCEDSREGFDTLLETQIKPIKEVVNPKLSVLGVVLNNYDSRSNYAKSYLETTKEAYGKYFFNTVIPNANKSALESATMMTPLIVYEPSSKLTTQYVELCAEILRRIKLGGNANVG